MEIRFKLNPKNRKDQVIINVLQGEYSPAETIKNILYKMGINGVDSQRMLFEGFSEGVKLSIAGDNNPTDGETWNRGDEPSRDDSGKPVEDNDIARFFSN